MYIFSPTLPKTRKPSDMFNIKAVIVFLAILLVTSARYLEDFDEGIVSSKYNGFVYFIYLFFFTFNF